jgi:hypothetical protein
MLLVRNTVLEFKENLYMYKLYICVSGIKPHMLVGL